MPYLVALSDAQAGALAAVAIVRTYRPRETVVYQGGPASGAYLVLDGRGRIFRVGPAGKEQSLRIIGRGDSFAEVPVFDDGPSPATVEALEALEVALLPGAALRAAIVRNPAVAQAALAHFARRLRAFTEMIEQVSTQSVTARLARFLYQSARVEGVRRGPDIVLTREVTIQDLASVVGSVREVVSRYLKEFETHGILTVSRHEFVIHDLDALRDLV